MGSAAIFISKSSGDLMLRSGAFHAVKRRKAIAAKKMDRAFVVESVDPRLQPAGKAGDYLMQDSRGRFYPCPADVFKATFEVV